MQDLTYADFVQCWEWAYLTPEMYDIPDLNNDWFLYEQEGTLPSYVAMRVGSLPPKSGMRPT